MTPPNRQLGILAGLLVAVLLATTCAPARQVRNDPTAGRLATAARQQTAELPERLQQLVTDGLTAQEVLGKCLWDSDWATLYRVVRPQNLDVSDYTIMCTAARCDDPAATARVLAGNNHRAAVEALAHSGVPYHRVLNALRLLIPETGVGVRQALFLAMTPPPLGLGLDPDDLADTLESPWPFNVLPPAPGPADPALVTGRVEMRGDLPVITTWGTPLERGYAQGVLLAHQLAEAWQPVSVRFFGHNQARLRQMSDLVFDFPQWALDEIKGLYLGMRAVLGEEGLAEHGNPTLQDLKALNCVADLNMMGCSSVSVWGNLIVGGGGGGDNGSDGGGGGDNGGGGDGSGGDGSGDNGDGGNEGIITGRNLDYSSFEALLAARAVSIVYPGEGRTPFVSIGWMGLVGCYTAMNADGVCLFMHDSQTAPGVLPVDSTPRSMALREALETCDSADPAGSIHASLREQFTVSGNNIHVSWPGGAACIEWNGDEGTDAGATLRVPGDAGEDPNWLVVTNHYVCRHRERPFISGRGGSSGERYDLLCNAVREAEPGSITPADVLEWLRSVSRRGTLHSVIAHPAQRRLTAYFRLPGTDSGAPYQDGLEFDVEALLTHRHQ